MSTSFNQILRWSYLACHLDLLKEKKHAQQESEKRRRLGEKRNYKQLVAR